MTRRERLHMLAGNADVERETLERHRKLVDAGRVHEALASWVCPAPPERGSIAAQLLDIARERDRGVAGGGSAPASSRRSRQ